MYAHKAKNFSVQSDFRTAAKVLAVLGYKVKIQGMTLTTDAGLGMVFTASKIGYGMVQGRAMSNSYTAWGEAVLRGEVSYISKRVQDSEGLHSDASIANMYETLRMMRAELRTRN